MEYGSQLVNRVPFGVLRPGHDGPTDGPRRAGVRGEKTVPLVKFRSFEEKRRRRPRRTAAAPTETGIFERSRSSARSLRTSTKYSLRRIQR
jgi:hypothetical protein